MQRLRPSAAAALGLRDTPPSSAQPRQPPPGTHRRKNGILGASSVALGPSKINRNKMVSGLPVTSQPGRRISEEANNAYLKAYHAANPTSKTPPAPAPSSAVPLVAPTQPTQPTQQTGLPTNANTRPVPINQGPQIEALNRDLAAAHATISNLEEELEGLGSLATSKLEEYDAELTDAVKSQVALEKVLDEQEEFINDLKADLLVAQDNKDKTKITALESNLAAKEAEILSTRAAYQSIIAEIERNLGQKLLNLQATINILEKKGTANSNTITELKNKEDIAKADVEALHNTLKKITANLRGQLEAEIAKGGTTQTSLEAALAKSQQMEAQLQMQQEDLNSVKRETKNSLAAKNAEIEAAKQALANARNSGTASAATIARLEAELAAAKAEQANTKAATPNPKKSRKPCKWRNLTKGGRRKRFRKTQRNRRR